MSVESSKLRALGAGVGAGVGGIAVSFVLIVAAQVGIALSAVNLSPLELIALTLVLTQGLSFGGVAIAYLTYRGVSLGDIGVRWPSLRQWGIAVGGWLFGLAALWAAGLVIQSTGAPTAENSVAEFGRQNPEVLLFLIPAAYVFIGPGEELLFRGVVQNRLREAFSPAVAVVLASFIFASIHFLALSGGGLSGKLVTISVLFLISLVFGVTYEYTENLVVPAFIHASYDATLFGLLYLSLKFTGGTPGLWLPF